MRENSGPEEGRVRAARLACRVLRANGVRTLPADPAALARSLGYEVISLSCLTEAEQGKPGAFRRYSAGGEAFTLAMGGGRMVIVYDETIRSPERIRFSLFHELGHILLDHFSRGDLRRLDPETAREMEEEANIFARNILCPPPVVDLIRGRLADPKWAALFCVSESAWRVRLETLEADRRRIDQETADLTRAHFLEYMFGRRCRDCGAVFTDEARREACPRCGCRRLLWNPRMETREQALGHRHPPGASAEDLKARPGEMREPDLTAYWNLIRKENARD